MKAVKESANSERRRASKAPWFREIGIFSNRSYYRFIEGTRSKVAGPWNLQILLPRAQDFLKPFSCIFGQAKYEAGNTYKDALAHCRTSQGEKAVSLDLGMVVEEGVVAGNNTLSPSPQLNRWPCSTTTAIPRLPCSRPCSANWCWR